MANDSSTGGYLNNPVTPDLPGELTLAQFIQTALAGVSGLDGTLVRPSWQRNPPKPPDIDVNWLAFQIQQGTSDANAFVGTDSSGTTTLQRHETLRLNLSFYGPDAYDMAGMVRDGFQLSQNREALTTAKMGFVSATDAMHMPDLVNELWRDRWTMQMDLRRMNIRVYPILTFASMAGTVTTVIGTTTYTQAFNSGSQS